MRDEIVESGAPPPSFGSHEKEGRKMSSESEAAPGTGKLVCVTGASGYIASWLVRLLLARGYTVRATVRDTCEPPPHLFPSISSLPPLSPFLGLDGWIVPIPFPVTIVVMIFLFG